MYSKCPKCGHKLSWLQKVKLSTTKAKPCPSCGVGLTKNPEGERLLFLGWLILFVAQFALLKLSGLKERFSILREDMIELPICLIIVLPALIYSVVCFKKSFSYSNLKVEKNSE